MTPAARESKPVILPRSAFILMPAILRCGRFSLDLSRPLVMGVVNVTPDSFSDGGKFSSPEAAVAHARRLIEEGADIVDLGGESSRPGAAPVPVEEELARILPVVRALRDERVPLSVDTTKPEVMRRAMARQAEVERERRAKIINAEGEFQAAEKLVQAANKIATEPVALQLRFLQTMSEISSERATMVVLPMPIELFKPYLQRAELSNQGSERK